MGHSEARDSRSCDEPRANGGRRVRSQRGTPRASCTSRAGAPGCQWGRGAGPCPPSVPAGHVPAHHSGRTGRSLGRSRPPPPHPSLSGPRGGAVPRRSRDGGAGALGRQPSGHSSVLPPGCGEARTALRARLDRRPLSAGRERLSSSSGTTPHLPPECRQLPRSHLKTAASFALSVQLRAACARPGASPRRLWGLSLAPPPRARPRAPGAKGTHAPRSRSAPRRGGGGGARGGNSWGRRARVRGPCRGPRPVDAAGRGTRWPRSRCCCGLPRSRAFGGNSLRFCTDCGGRPRLRKSRRMHRPRAAQGAGPVSAGTAAEHPWAPRPAPLLPGASIRVTCRGAGSPAHAGSSGRRARGLSAERTAD